MLWWLNRRKTLQQVQLVERLTLVEWTLLQQQESAHRVTATPSTVNVRVSTCYWLCNVSIEGGIGKINTSANVA